MKTQLSSNVETITPAIAAQLLKKNTKNRKLRDRRVNRLVKAIQSGQWQINGDAIRIAKDGTLLDGQHRLAAIIISKKPIQSFVVRGLPPECMTTIDLGAVRTCGDHLRMAGYKGAVYALAAAAGVCLSFRKGVYVERKEKMSPDDMFQYIEANKRILKSAEIYTHSKLADFQKLLPQSVSVATHYLFTQIDRDKGESFFHHLVSGINLGKTSPILKLRTELIGMREETKRGKVSRRTFVHLMTTAFQAYLNDSRIERLPEYKPETKVMLPRVK